MSPERIAPIARHTTRLLLADPAPIIVTTLMPLALMAFLQGMGRAVLVGQGHVDATVAEHVVPGMAVLFSLFGIVYVGMAIFQEHGWGTWERLRASPASGFDVLVGKLLPPGAVLLVQTGLLFLAGVLLFDLVVTGSVVALLVMIVLASLLVLALSMVCVAVFRTINQLSSAANVGAMVLAGLGGALAPVDVLPVWAQTIAPLSPAYWVLDGFLVVTLDGGGLAAVARPALVLVGWSAALAAVAARRFRFADEKVWT